MGADDITLRNKYLHKQAHNFDVEISAKMAILAVFKALRESFSKMGSKLAWHYDFSGWFSQSHLIVFKE